MGSSFELKEENTTMPADAAIFEGYSRAGTSTSQLKDEICPTALLFPGCLRAEVPTVPWVRSQHVQFQDTHPAESLALKKNQSFGDDLSAK